MENFPEFLYMNDPCELPWGQAPRLPASMSERSSSRGTTKRFQTPQAFSSLTRRETSRSHTRTPRFWGRWKIRPLPCLSARQAFRNARRPMPRFCSNLVLTVASATWPVLVEGKARDRLRLPVFTLRVKLRGSRPRFCIADFRSALSTTPNSFTFSPLNPAGQATISTDSSRMLLPSRRRRVSTPQTTVTSRCWSVGSRLTIFRSPHTIPPRRTRDRTRYATGPSVYHRGDQGLGRNRPPRLPASESRTPPSARL
jgi:hypothetical protein